MSETPPTVVPFKLIKNPSPPTESAAQESASCGLSDEEFAAMPDERKQIIGALANIGTFLLDNKLRIEHVVCGVGVNADDPEDPEGRHYFLLTTPLTNAEFALSLKLMESALMNNIQSGNY